MLLVTIKIVEALAWEYLRPQDSGELPTDAPSWGDLLNRRL
jgi:hypothetical protein